MAELLDVIPSLTVPDLAGSTPLWLALLTVLVNAIVGALRGTLDRTRDWTSSESARSHCSWALAVASSATC